MGLTLENESEERTALRRDGYLSAIDDALEVAREFPTRADIIGELCQLRSEVAAA